MQITHSATNPIKMVVRNSTKMTLNTNLMLVPIILTKDKKPLTEETIYMIFGKSRNGVDEVCLYPLNAKPEYAPSANLIVPADSELQGLPATYTVFKHRTFVVIRTLDSVVYRAVEAINKRCCDQVVVALMSLVKHLYFSKIVGNEMIDQVTPQFDKLEKIFSRAAGTTFAGERDAAHQVGLGVATRLLSVIYEPIAGKENEYGITKVPTKAAS